MVKKHFVHGHFRCPRGWHQECVRNDEVLEPSYHHGRSITIPDTSFGVSFAVNPVIAVAVVFGILMLGWIAIGIASWLMTGEVVTTVPFIDHIIKYGFVP